MNTLPGLTRERRQDGELARGELDGAPVCPHVVPHLIDQEITNLQLSSFPALSSCAPEQGAHTSDQLSRAERLRDVVVGAGLQAGHVVFSR